jgi:tetratricopeptide (TPR) repeat protein
MSEIEKHRMERAKEHFATARKLENEGNRKEAIRYYMQAKAFAPNKYVADAYLKCARSLMI